MGGPLLEQGACQGVAGASCDSGAQLSCVQDSPALEILENWTVKRSALLALPAASNSAVAPKRGILPTTGEAHIPSNRDCASMPQDRFARPRCRQRPLDRSAAAEHAARHEVPQRCNKLLASRHTGERPSRLSGQVYPARRTRPNALIKLYTCDRARSKRRAVTLTFQSVSLRVFASRSCWNRRVASW